ncbi:PLP-dependent aminotransferase family protein [Streptomyces sp. DH12]|uniref:MocR-like pyridoxine biosynthesis transcription factor PdxR n=1 Tax=Streptomyces sp. DH12 TaxID=2857010 RepID=UPI001E3D8797|nr:PLP-dependent aminotransferase family protein [Streptomyces sp. DH12]
MSVREEGGGTWELLAPVAAAPARARGRALREALRDAVRRGRLAAGTRLPSTRELAAELGVSRGLVTEAYEQLTAEGYLRSARGSGTWVGDAARAPAPGGARDLAPHSPGVRVDFRPGVPDLSLFPRAAWAAAYKTALGGLAHRRLGYPDPRGLPELRTALAALLTRRRGVVADPERLVVCAGVAQALTLVGSVLRERGERSVGVEDPGSPNHGALFAAVGLRAVGVPLDSEGAEPGVLAASGVRAVVTTPAHQFPLGIGYSAGRRAALLDWARDVDGWVVEDDYDGDFRYDREPVGALQGLDPERVVHTGSVSKSLAPGLRLGWLLLPEALAEAVVERKRMADLGCPVLDQAVLADFVARGGYDRHLRRCRSAYRERRDALVRALAAALPGTEVTGIAAGLHVIARVPARYGPAAAFLERAAAAGVVLRPLTDYGTDREAGGGAHTGGGAEGRAGGGGAALVLGYAHLSPADIARGVRALADAVRGRGPGTS